MNNNLLTFIELNNEFDFLNIAKDNFEPLEKAFPDIQFEYMKSYQELKARIAEPDIIIGWKFPEHLYSKADNLKAIFTPAAGKDWLAEDPDKKVLRFFSGFHGELISESMLGMMLYFTNQFDRTLENQRLRQWQRNIQFDRRLLRGQHVLIIGYGSIGKTCARLLNSFHCSMSGLQRKYNNQTDQETGVKYITMDSIHLELALADHVVCILPGSKETSGIISRDHFKSMKASAYFYNFGRGNVVQDKDIIWALETKEIAGAGLDVFAKEPLSSDSKLWQMKNVLITPHSSCSYVEYGSLFVEELTIKLTECLKSGLF